MPIPEEIQDFVEKHIKLMVSQTETFLPFIKVAYPYSKSLPDAVYSLIAGNALTVFLNQYAMRMKYPSSDDFTDFGRLVAKYREQVDRFFK